MAGIRTVVIWSSVLAVASFVGMLALAPIVSPRFNPSPRRVPTAADSDIRIRIALAEGRREAALNIATNATRHHPETPTVWLWLATVEHLFGDEYNARNAAEKLLDLLERQDPPRSDMEKSTRSYHAGWALLALGRRDESRAAFVRAADVLEASPVFQPVPLFLRYNLACYRAMGGQHDVAAEHFALAVDGGYSDSTGWWRVDPDLGPIREHPVFLRAAALLGQQPGPGGPRPLPDDIGQGSGEPLAVPHPGGSPETDG